TLANNASLTNPAALSFTVNPAAADRIALSGASSSTAGVESANLTATLQDQFGNAATRGSDTVITPASSSGSGASAFHDTSSATRGSDVVVTPSSSSAGPNKAFHTTGSVAQATFTIAAGSSAVSFRYYDELAGVDNINLTNDATSPSLTNPGVYTFTVAAAAA